MSLILDLLHLYLISYSLNLIFRMTSTNLILTALILITGIYGFKSDKFEPTKK